MNVPIGPVTYVHSKDLLIPLEVHGPVDEVSARVSDLVKSCEVVELELAGDSRMVVHFGRLTCVWISDHLPEGPAAAVVEL